jgi:WD40 repeat protein
MNSLAVVEPPTKRARHAAEADDAGPKGRLDNPIMLLTGHEAPIYTCAFDPLGKLLASGSQDKQIC